MFAIALAAAVLSGQDTTSQRSASDLTRDLNSGPPVRPAASASPAPPSTPPVSASPAGAPQAAANPVATTPTGQGANSALTRDLNSAPPSAVRSPAPATTPSPATPSSPSVARPAVPGPVVAPPQPPTQQPSTTQRAPASSSVPASAPSAQVGSPRGLDASAVAALPFRLELPSELVLTQSRAGADAQIYAVRRGQTPLVMIYAGPASQFPIYDGQVVQAGGRASVVVSEGARRLALEHLFRRSSSPEEIHVWVAAADGADRDLGERIAQSVDAR